jgi:hypothetical protein
MSDNDFASLLMILYESLPNMLVALDKIVLSRQERSRATRCVIWTSRGVTLNDFAGETVETMSVYKSIIESMDDIWMFMLALKRTLVVEC